MSTLLLENNPLHCRCGGIVHTEDLDLFYVAECDLCGESADGETAAEAEIAFQRWETEPPSVFDQALDRGCLQGFAGNVVVCGVENAAREYQLPSLLRHRSRLGCILVDTSTDDHWIANKNREYCSLVLFHPSWWEEAWSIARRLRHSHPGCGALVRSGELSDGIFISLSSHHRIILDGEAFGS
ncbi:MAG: hypothetical protein P4L99_21835 [Chthoniobacter sp.]|nr:hypothetical protein [Chthoniobacter sp.]